MTIKWRTDGRSEDKTVIFPENASQQPVLIGLDLSRHSGRVRADLALRLLEVTTFAG